MDKAKIPFTQTGYDRLVADLSAVRAKREPALVKLQAAREQGDLSENGAYKAARFELSDIDRAIRRLSYLLKMAVVTPPRRDGIVGFGTTITLLKEGKQVTYVLVSMYESDPLHHKLSLESPLGSALVGKKPGDTVTITAPSGSMTYTIQTVG